MAIKIYRQNASAASAAPPSSLNYGELACDKDGTIYVGNSSDKAVSRVSYAVSAGTANSANLATTATTATNASQDASGNTITTSYGSSIDVSGNTIRLKSKSGAVLSTITSPYATRADLCNSIQIHNSNWNGTDGLVSAVYADANKSCLNLTASNAAGTAWPDISVSRINGHFLSMGYDGNLWIGW